MASGFPREFSQPIGFVVATFTCLNLFIFSPATTQGWCCTNSEVMDSHLGWCFLWQEDVDILKRTACCWKGKEGGRRLSGSSGRRWKSMTPITTETTLIMNCRCTFFCKKLWNFHHIRFRANYIRTSISLSEGKLWEWFGLLLSKAKLITKQHRINILIKNSQPCNWLQNPIFHVNETY